MKDKSACIVYCSSNMEDPVFERKIQETIIKNAGGLPIISVTQKPMNFGTNYCVGNVGVSEMNFLRQLLIGCKAAKTKYIISAESDCLYDESYFQFRPTKNNACYRNNNTYIIGTGRKCFWKKPEGGTWCQVINRNFYIRHLEELLYGAQKWDANAKRFVKEKGRKFFDSFETFATENPCISIKASGGMHKFSNSERVDIPELPYWGTGETIFNHYIK